MNRQTANVLSTVLILLAAVIFIVALVLGLPRLLSTSSEPTPVPIVFVATEVVATENPAPSPTTEVVAPTTAPAATEVVLPTPVLEASLAATEPVQAAPTDALEPTAVPATQTPIPPTTTTEPTPTPILPTPTPDLPLVFANEDAALFFEAGGVSGRTEFYIPAGRFGWLHGASADRRWLHVSHLLGAQGWVSARFMDMEEADILALPLSDYVAGETPPQLASNDAENEDPIAAFTPTPDALVIIATQDAALFAESGGFGHIGYYVPTGQPAWLLGRSESGHWLHVAHRLGVEGWVTSQYFDTASIDIAALPVSDFATEPDESITPNALVAATATPWPTRSPWQPTSTPWPTRTPWPSRTPAAQGNNWQTPTPWPTATAWPTSTPTPRPTQPPAGLPYVSPTPLPYEPPMASSIAFWRIQTEPTRSGNTWRAEIAVRVPTSLSYSFEMANLVSSRLQTQNFEGDDIYILTIANVPCGSDFSAELTARQNGAKMPVWSESTRQPGPVTIAKGC